MHAQPALPVVGVWSDSYGSANVTDTTLVVGSMVTFEMNVTGAPPFNGYELTLYYDPGYLKAQSDDFATGTVFNAPLVAKNDLSQPGTVAVAVVNLGSSFNLGSGTLFHITFLVTNIGVSPLTLAQGIGNPGVGAQSWTRLVLGFATIDVTTTDGYFKNDLSRTGPVPVFNTTPTNPLQGETIIFDSSASFDPENMTGPSRGISQYIWDFGDGTSFGTLFPAISHRFGGIQPVGFTGNFSVRLTVVNNNNRVFEGMITDRLAVSTNPPPATNFGLATIEGGDGSPPIVFGSGGSSTSSVAVQSLGGFQGNVSVTSLVVPTVPDGPDVSFAPSLLQVSSGSRVQTFMTVTTSLNTPPGNYGIIITGNGGGLSNSILVSLTILKSTSFPRITVRNFFTDGSGSRLPVDSTGSPSVNVVLAHGTVRSTNPGQVLAWTNLTNTGTVSFSSLRMETQLPSDWTVSQPNQHSVKDVFVFFEFGNRTILDITRSVSVSVSGSSPETVDLTVNNLTGTPAGTTLDPHDSLLLSVKLDYALVGTRHLPSNFPVTYQTNAIGIAWSLENFAGVTVSATGSAIFNANAKVLGDVNGDLTVNILDLALVAYSFNSTPGTANWNPAANLEGSGKIDIGDLAIVASNFGDSY